MCLDAVYEGQGAIEFEAAIQGAWDTEEAYPLPFAEDGEGGLLLDPAPLLQGVLHDIEAGTTAGLVSLRFHKALVESGTAVTRRILDRSGPMPVVLTAWPVIGLRIEASK